MRLGEPKSRSDEGGLADRNLIGSPRMRVFLAAVMIASLAGPAFAQEKPIAKYGEQTAKSPQEIAAEKEADKAYKRSLGNIPDKGPTDPWGNVRSDAAPKPVEKAAHVKRAKADGAVK
jgi:hypothetical protein